VQERGHFCVKSHSEPGSITRKHEGIRPSMIQPNFD
jgi:hypothetical protein